MTSKESRASLWLIRTVPQQARKVATTKTDHAAADDEVVQEIAVAVIVAAKKKSQRSAAMKSVGTMKSRMTMFPQFALRSQAKPMPAEMRDHEETTDVIVPEADAVASHDEIRRREIQRHEIRRREIQRHEIQRHETQRHAAKVGASPCVMNQGVRPLHRAKVNGANPFEKMRGVTKLGVMRLLAR